MATVTPAQISSVLKAGAVIYFAPVGEARPAATVLAGEDWGGDWEPMGLTSAPLVIKHEEEVSELFVEQFPTAVQRNRTSRALSFETTLAEMTADNVALVLNGTKLADVAATASAFGYEAADIGGELCSGIAEYAIGFEGVSCDPTDGQLPVRWFLYRATITLNGDITFSQHSDDYAGFPFLAQALADPTTGKMAYFQRATAAPTG